MNGLAWQLWVVIGYLVLNALFAIGMIGRRRGPITPSEAVINTLVAVGLILLLLGSA
jgi:hypothetical protein